VSVKLQVHSTRRTCWSVANGQLDLAIIGGEVPPELQDALEMRAFAEDELVLILPPKHLLNRGEVISRDELYQMRFIALDTQSTIRKVIDKILSQYDIDTSRFRVEMELNSIEAIKNAVQSGLGTAFVSNSAITKELELGTLQRGRIENISIRRTLWLIVNPNRYQSRAAETFTREVLPLFPNLLPEALKIPVGAES
jgi:DNA-binding transcriptional LysR family regulator